MHLNLSLARALECHSSVRVWDCRERQTLRTDHRHHSLAAQNKPQTEHTLPMVVALEGKWDNQDTHPSFPLRALSSSQRPADVLFGPCVCFPPCRLCFAATLNYVPLWRGALAVKEERNTKKYLSLHSSHKPNPPKRVCTGVRGETKRGNTGPGCCLLCTRVPFGRCGRACMPAL